MEHVTAMVRVDHLDQIEEVKETETLIRSDDDAVRYIFDRAQEADLLEREVEHLQKKIEYLEEQHEEEVREVGMKHVKYGNRVYEEVEKLREKLHELEQQEEESSTNWEAKTATETQRNAILRAGLLKRLKWKLTGVPTEIHEE